MEAFLFGWAIAALVGVLIADSKNRDKGEGCALGCLLGPIGWLIEALLPSKERDRSSSSSTTDGKPFPYSSSSSGGESSSTQGSKGKDRRHSRPRRKCPFCAEIILLEAKVCKHCGRDVEPGDESDEVRLCPYCDVPISVDAEECPECLVVEPFE